MVQSIQIGPIAVVVPPSSLVVFGAVGHVIIKTMIIVLVICRKLHIAEMK